MNKIMKSNIISIITLIISLTALGGTYIRVIPFEVTNDTYIGIIATFIGVSVTLLIGYQIFNAIEIKNEILEQKIITAKLKVMNADLNKIIETQQHVTKEGFDIISATSLYNNEGRTAALRAFGILHSSLLHSIKTKRTDYEWIFLLLRKYISEIDWQNLVGGLSISKDGCCTCNDPNSPYFRKELKDIVKEHTDKIDGDEAGIKTVTILVSGDNAYGYLKAEKGVHRLVRISPFDSQSRRHTSFSSLEVMPEIENDAAVVINMEEVRVDTYRSGGAGGQHVNTTDSAVRMTHIPTGIVVQCQNERSQIKNRDVAIKMLKSKLIAKQEQDRIDHDNEIKGSLKRIEWGSQIRSYVFCPYTMAKDHRTGCETGNISAVMDGDIGEFIEQYLIKA